VLRQFIRGQFTGFATLRIDISRLGINIRQFASALQELMSIHRPIAASHRIPTDARVAIVAARFNGRFVDELLRGATDRLKVHGLDGDRVEIHRVPGAFELPVAAKQLIDTGRFGAVICLGCVIRGETAHFEYVAGEAARGIQQVAVSTGIPIIFGVLTTENEAQTLDRLGGAHGHAGESAADAAAEMLALREQIAAGKQF